MFIAAKYEEVFPLRMSVVYEKIAHKKLTEVSIRRKEREILNALNFELTGVNPFEFLSILLWSFRERVSERVWTSLWKFAMFLGRLTQFNYDMISTVTSKGIAASIMYLGLKKLESQGDEGIVANDELSEIANLFGIEDVRQIIENSGKILTFGKTFEKSYSNLENLLKFCDESKTFMEKLQSIRL